MAGRQAGSFVSLQRSSHSLVDLHDVIITNLWRNRSVFGAALHLRCADIESSKSLSREQRNTCLALRHGPSRFFST